MRRTPAASPSNYLEAGLLFLGVEQSLLELLRYLLRGEVSSDPSSEDCENNLYCRLPPAEESLLSSRADSPSPDQVVVGVFTEEILYAQERQFPRQE